MYDSQQTPARSLACIPAQDPGGRHTIRFTIGPQQNEALDVLASTAWRPGAPPFGISGGVRCAMGQLARFAEYPNVGRRIVWQVGLAGEFVHGPQPFRPGLIARPSPEDCRDIGVESIHATDRYLSQVELAFTHANASRLSRCDVLRLVVARGAELFTAYAAGLRPVAVPPAPAVDMAKHAARVGSGQWSPEPIAPEHPTTPGAMFCTSSCAK